MNDELLKYYEYLKGQQADLPETVEKFYTSLQDDVSAQKYYNYLRENDFDTPESFESFQNTFGLKKKVVSGYAGPYAPEELVQPSPEPSLLAQTKPEEILVTPPGPVQQDFGTATIEDIEGQMRAEMEADRQQSVPGMALPGEDVKMAFDRPGQQMLPGPQQLAENRFEAKKDLIKELIVKEDKAVMAEEMQKYSGVLIDKIDKEIASLPKDVSFEDTGTGSVSAPRNEKREIMQMAREILEEVKDHPDQGGFFEGLLSKGAGVLPFVGGLPEGSRLKEIYKATQTEAPKPEQQQLMTAQAIKEQFEAVKENPEGFFSYNSGRVLAEMLPYVAEYALTAGAYTTTRELVTQGLKTVLKGAATKPAVLNGVIKPISTIAGVVAQTAANPQRVVQTTLERMTPQMKLALDMDKNELRGEVDKGLFAKPGESFEEAFTKAFGVNALELLTERFGQWSTEAGDAMKLNGDWLPQVIFGKWMEKRGFTSLVKAKEVARQIGYDGIIKEIWFEEYPNKILQNLVTGDQPFTPDFFNPLAQEFLDMIPATVIMGGGPMAAGVAARMLEKKVTAPQGDIGKPQPKGKGDFTDIDELTQKLKSEKPKEQTGPVPTDARPVPETPKEAPLPVQSEPKEKAEEVEKTKVFVYGTLKTPSTRKEALGEDVDTVSATISGFSKHDGDYPNIVVSGKGEVKGQIMDLTPEQVEKLDKWESKYTRREVQPGVFAYFRKSDEKISEKEALEKAETFEEYIEFLYERPYESVRETLGDEVLGPHIRRWAKELGGGTKEAEPVLPAKEETPVQKITDYQADFEVDLKARGFADQQARATAKILAKAMTDREAALTLLHTGNRNSRQLWSKRTGVELPATQSGTQAAINKYFDQLAKPKSDFFKEIDVTPVKTTKPDWKKMTGEEQFGTKETFGKGFKVIGVNSEGDKVGVDDRGVRAVLKGRIVVSQPIMLGRPGSGDIFVDDPSGEFITTEEETKKQPTKEQVTLSDITKTDFGKKHILVVKPPAPKTIDDYLSQRIPKEMRGKNVKVRLIKNGKEETVEMPAEVVLVDLKTRAGIKKAKGGKSPMEDLIDCFGKK